MLRIVMLTIVILAFTLTVQAMPKSSTDHGQARQSDPEMSADHRRETFSPAERNLIRAHLIDRKPGPSRQNTKSLPPGLQKKMARGKPLPPGWQKKIATGRSLDYQVYRQGESLPDSLLRRLPPPPIGSEILQVEDKIILLNSSTRTILDAFDLIPVR